MKTRMLFLALILSLGLLPAPGQAAADKVSKLLTSGTWCSVRVGPDGRRIRIVFHADGHYVLTGDHRGNKGHWRVKSGVLYMGEGDKKMEPVAHGIRQVRRGRYIVFVDGEEFARCK